MARVHRGRDAAARGEAAAAGAGRAADARGTARRLCPGGDGPRRHDLHAAGAGLRHLPVGRRLRRAAGRHRRRSAVSRRRRRRSRCATGIAYLALRADGAVLAETRPASGLLGGMLGLPCSAWSEAPPAPRPPFAADWRDLRVEVRHTFTHFHLVLRLQGARVPARFAAPCRHVRAGRRPRRRPPERHAQGAPPRPGRARTRGRRASGRTANPAFRARLNPDRPAWRRAAGRGPCSGGDQTSFELGRIMLPSALFTVDF